MRWQVAGLDRRALRQISLLAFCRGYIKSNQGTPPALRLPLLTGYERCEYMTTRFPLLSCSRFPDDTLVSPPPPPSHPGFERYEYMTSMPQLLSCSRFPDETFVSFGAQHIQTSNLAIAVSRDGLRLRDELTSHRSRIRSTNA